MDARETGFLDARGLITLDQTRAEPGQKFREIARQALQVAKQDNQVLGYDYVVLNTTFQAQSNHRNTIEYLEHQFAMQSKAKRRCRMERSATSPPRDQSPPSLNDLIATSTAPSTPLTQTGSRSRTCAQDARPREGLSYESTANSIVEQCEEATCDQDKHLSVSSHLNIDVVSSDPPADAGIVMSPDSARIRMSLFAIKSAPQAA